MLTVISEQGKTHWPSKMQGILNISLQQWRRSLPEVMQWKDHDPPSKDINVARMRAKYYGACYIIHRPLLYYALHIAKRPASVEFPPTAAQVGGQVTEPSTQADRAIGKPAHLMRIGSTFESTTHEFPNMR